MDLQILFHYAVEVDRKEQAQYRPTPKTGVDPAIYQLNTFFLWSQTI